MTNTNRPMSSYPVIITYRAAFIGETVLTLPKHACLDDIELLAEADAECKRAGIEAVGIEIGDWTGNAAPDFYDGLDVSFDMLADKSVEGFEYNASSIDAVKSAAGALCNEALTDDQAGYLLAAIKNWADCTTDSDSWHARKAVLHPSER